MAFIIEKYNRYDRWDREHSKYIFEINEQWYAVKEVILFWGQPQLPIRIERNEKPETYPYFIYDTEEQAMEFVKLMKSLNCGGTY